MIDDVLAGRRRWWVECCDVLDGLRALPDESVHCVVTSIPYWGLRDYGTGRWEGGDPGCDHAVRKPATVVKQQASSSLEGGKATVGHQREGFKGACGRCGARRVDQQIGLEPTFAEFLRKITAVFTEVRRVLDIEGTLWLNVGDAYNSGTSSSRKPSEAEHGYWQAGGSMGDRRVNATHLKTKDLMGQPWRVAFALQEAGWWLRSDVVWSKPSPMPESVTDRPTRAHEYLFLLTRSPHYHYDADAIREPHAEATLLRARYPWTEGERATGHTTPGEEQRWRAEARTLDERGRHRRSVWTIASEPFPEAHFATFPTALVEPCVLAGCPVDGVVLDPFSGSGTTVMVALRHGRRGIGLELNPQYVEMSRRRIVNDAPMFNTEAAG